MMRQNLKAWVVLGAGLGVLFYLGLLSIHAPFGRDQGVAAYVAEVMARGGVVYIDVYHFNLPAIFFTYRLSKSLVLPWPECINLLHLILVMAAGLGVFAGARRLLGPMASAFAALFFGAFAVIMYTNYWDIAQKDSLACLPLSLSLLFNLLLLAPEGGEGGAVKGPGVPGLVLFAILAGAMAGAAAQFKPTLGIVLAASLHPVWKRRQQRGRALAMLFGAGAGFGLSLIPLLFYLERHQAFSAMIESVIEFGAFYGGRNYQNLSEVLLNTGRGLAGWIYEWRFLIVLSAAAFFGMWKKGPRSRLVIIFAALLLAQVIIQMKFFTYHWIPLLVPLAVMAAFGAARITGNEGPGGRATASTASSRILVLVLIALFVGSLWPDAKRYRREWLYDHGRIDDINFLAPYGPWGSGDICPLAQMEAARYLRKNTDPEDPVLVVGHELGLYVLADRYAPTRFAYDQPLMTEPRGDRAFAEYRESLRSEFLADIDRRPPRYILVIEDDRTGVESRDSWTQMRSFAGLRERIDRDYVQETIIEDYHIYKRLGQGADGGIR